MPTDSEAQRSAVPIKRGEVKKFFEDRGYKVVKLSQQWRHVTGEIEKEGKRLKS